LDDQEVEILVGRLASSLFECAARLEVATGRAQ
jgi:hypothetical protein